MCASDSVCLNKIFQLLWLQKPQHVWSFRNNKSISDVVWRQTLNMSNTFSGTASTHWCLQYFYMQHFVTYYGCFGRDFQNFSGPSFKNSCFFHLWLRKIQERKLWKETASTCRKFQEKADLLADLKWRVPQFENATLQYAHDSIW